MHKLENLPDVLTAEALSQFLSLSKRRVYELMALKADAGGIPCMKIGRNKRVLKADFVNWMNKTKEEI